MILLHALWHPLSSNGASLYGGILGDIGELTLIGTILGTAFAAYKHHQCEQDGCRRLGHPHPGHGRPVCREHYHHDIAPPATKPDQS